jgi:hypothetical protein
VEKNRSGNHREMTATSDFFQQFTTNMCTMSNGTIYPPVNSDFSAENMIHLVRLPDLTEGDF